VLRPSGKQNAAVQGRVHDNPLTHSDGRSRHTTETKYGANDAYYDAPFFRTPNNLPWYDTSPRRVVNRHSGRANSAYVDGHAEVVKAGRLGFQYAHGHALAMWDKE
jgi:prepilin-type processing-associated H-X9-DG protein